MKFLNGVLLGVLCILVLSTHNSNAAAIALPQSGQFKCYSAGRQMLDQNSWTNTTTEKNCLGSGQDGEIRAGTAWPNPRFVDNGDATITDNLTALQWAKDANLIKSRDPAFDADSYSNYSLPQDGMVTWQHALDYIAKFNSEGFAGHSDWRLPNSLEIGSLDYTSAATVCTQTNYNHCLKNIFLNFPTSYLTYWSSTSWAANASYAYAHFGGQVSWETKVSNRYVWPVRGATSGQTALPKTGQTSCYDESGAVIECAGTRQDGDLKMGIAHPQPRFTSNDDNTFTDNLTGLIWPRNSDTPGPAACLSGGRLEWRDLAQYIRCLNANLYLGHGDWRLPNVVERSSLADYGQNDANWLAPLYIDTPAFNLDLRWSSTLIDNRDMPDMAFVGVQQRSGWDTVGYPGEVWPVRGGSFPATPQHIVTGKVAGLGGTISCSPAIVSDGENSVCTVTPNSNYSLNILTDNGNAVTEVVAGNKYIVTNVREEHQISASFLGNATYRLYLVSDGQAFGTILSDPQGISCSHANPTGCSASFRQGTEVTLTALTDWKTIFDGWNMGDFTISANPTSLKVYGATLVTPVFSFNLQAKDLGTGTEFPSLQDAYDAITSDASLGARVYSFQENVTLNKPYNLTFLGGKDSGYQSTVGSTTLHGVLQVSNGSITVENLILQ